ncbi:PKD domain-containing protein [Ekhidna sp.]
MRFLVKIALWVVCASIYAQNPDFSIPASVCRDQTLDITNNSTGFTNYAWDFCEGDLSETPSFTDPSLTVATNISRIRLIEDESEWHGFATSQGGNFYHLYFGSSLTNTPTVTNHGSFGLLTGSFSSDFIEEGGSWYGLITNLNNGTITRLSFGTSLSNVPTAANVNVTGGIGLPTDIDIVTDGGNVFALFGRFNASASGILEFGNSITNDAVKTTITYNGGGHIGVNFIEDNDVWYAYIVSSTIELATFGASITNTPSSIENVTLDLAVTDGTSMDVFKDAGDYIGILASDNGNIYQVNFGDDPSAATATVTNLGNFGTLTNVVGIGGAKEESEYHFFAANLSGSQVYALDFHKDCGANIEYSEETEPSNIQYSISGTVSINLSATDGTNTGNISKDLIVQVAAAPSVSISVDAPRCSNTQNQFMSIDDGSITSYSWDFDGDGMEDSDIQNPTFTFTSTGSYDIDLTVISSTGCTGFATTTVEIYDEPTDPDFSFSPTTVCSFSEVSFTNLTLENGSGPIVEYVWDFNGEGSSNDKDPTFTFTTTGMKTVTMLARIPGCTTALETQVINVAEGPSVDFSYTNNCFGEAIQFQDNTTGVDIDTYSWDFGDGQFSALPNPIHMYLTTGDFDVSLTVSNLAGCSTTYEETITVSNDPKVDFNFTDATENIAIDFTGEDLTGTDDAISSWSWDFDGLGVSTLQNPEFTFSSPADYTVTLDIETTQGCAETIQKTVTVSEALAPTIDFTVSSSVCINETVNIDNSTVNADSYAWDFCQGDLIQTPTFVDLLTTIGTNVTSFEVVNDNGEWHAFATRSVNFYHLYFGSDLTNTPVVTNHGNLGILNGAYSSVFLNESGSWYGLVTNLNTSNVARLSFGSNLSNVPTAEIVTTTGNSIGLPTGIDLTVDNGNVFAVYGRANTGTSGIIEFGNSITNDGVVTNIVFDSGHIGVDLISQNGEWFAIVVSDIIELASFGSSLSGTPNSIEEIILDVPITTGSYMEVYLDGTDYIGILADGNGSIYRINLGSNLSDASGTVTDLGNFSTFSNVIGFGGAQQQSSYHFFAIDNGASDVYRLDFQNDCGVSIEFSEDADPTGITYSISGNYEIKFSAFNSNSSEPVVSNSSITILPSVAPDISFTIDESRCLTVINQFNSVDDGSSLTYSWDFDSDGLEDSDAQNPTFDYGAVGAGTYTVRLDVNDGTCNNFFEQVITIYEAPPAPSYTYSAPRTCVNTDYSFTNTTADGSYTGPLVYLWEFIDEPSGNVVATANTRDAIYAFETEGQKTVRLTSSIPGCSEVTEQTLIITPGPTANFFAASICQDEAMQFTNTSTDATSYTWDFGDGFMSSATNPSHIFNGAGNFFVSLTAIDAEGCEDTEVIEVAVSDSPQISFDFDIPCTAADGIQFTDLTTVDNADLVSWTWFVDDEEVSTEQSPMIIFSSTGLKNIRLDVQSSNGCESSYSEDIEVLESPTPDFLISLGCQGEASTFTDNTSSVGNPIVSWLWTVDGVNYGTQDIDHVFENPGLFDVTLEITGQNFCSETITRTVEIIELPAISFVVDGECDNQLISATDQSSEFSDPIIARRWMLDGAVVGSGSQVILSDLEDNTYELALELETQAGCVINSTQILEINNAPESSFSSTRTYGIPGDEITFTNTSTGGISSQWLLNGEVRSSDPISETINFPIAGTYDVGLVTQNSLGCYDTLIQEILIATPEVDLAIGSFELISEDNIGRIFLEVQNFSNLPIEITEAQIVLENTFTITEQIVEFIDVGESTLVSLNVGIPLTVSEPSYFCVNLLSQYSNYPDIEPVNNEKCITIDPIIRLEDPFPNPVTDQFRLKLVLNEPSTASISLINSAGKIKLNQLRDVTDGLNNFFIDMSTLEPGIYYVLVDVQGKTLRKKVIKL